MDAIFKVDLIQFFAQDWISLPLTLLHAVALIGLVAILLLFMGNWVISSSARNVSMGIALGIGCFCMSYFLQDHIHEKFKPILIVDFLFIAGVVGGWLNALIVFCFAILGRYIFGETANISFAILLFAFIAAGSVFAHRFIVPNILSRFNFKSIFLLVCLRFAFSILAVIVIWSFQIFPDERMATLLVRQAIHSFTISFFIIGAVMFLLHRVKNWKDQYHQNSVSGFANRRAFQRYLKKLYKRATKSPSSTYVLLLLSIRNFQQLIQTHGHDWVEDLHKKTVTELINIGELPAFNLYRPLVFSFSDSSFALVLGNTTKEEVQIDGIAKNFLSRVIFLIKKKNNTLQPFFCLSVIDIIPTGNFDTVDFLRTLSFVEKRQSDRIQFFEQDITQHVRQEEHIRGMIAQWIEVREVPMWLQPKIDMRSGCCHGAEALLRTSDGSNTEYYIHPHDIFRIAEKYNMDSKLEWAIIHTVMGYFEKLPSHLKHISLSVNLTPGVFNRSGFARKMTELLEEKHIPPDRIVIELIETNKLANSETVEENIRHLIDYGICLSLDDFGTGYSSLSLLSKFYFKELKLDYSMISNASDPRVYSAIQIAIEGAQKYQASIVAEGIETEDQQRLMLGMGVCCGQGYLFGKAMPLDQFIEYVMNAPHVNVDGTDTRAECVWCKEKPVYPEQPIA